MRVRDRVGALILVVGALGGSYSFGDDLEAQLAMLEREASEELTDQGKERLIRELNALSKKYVIRSEFERCLTVLEEAIRLDPSDPNTLYNIGNVYVWRRELDRAEPFLVQAAKSNFPYAYNDLATIAWERDRNAIMALKLLNTAYHIEPREEFLEAKARILGFAGLEREPEGSRLGLDDRIEIDMRMPTPDRILEHTGIPRMECTVDNYDEWRGEFEAFYRQEGVSASERKPVVVFFYSNYMPEGPFDKRSAILFRESFTEHGDEFLYLRVNADWSDERRTRPYPFLLRDYGVDGPPSIMMLSPWDFTKGENQTNHRGTVKVIDIQGGGADDGQILRRWIVNLSPFWIEPNLIRPNGSYANRFNGDSSIERANYE